MTANIRIMNGETEDIAKALKVIADELAAIRAILAAMMNIENDGKKVSLRISGHISKTEEEK